METWLAAYQEHILEEFDLEWGLGIFGKEDPENYLSILGRFCGKRKVPKILVFVVSAEKGEGLEDIWEMINRAYIRKRVVYAMDRKLGLELDLAGMKALSGTGYFVGGSLTGLDRTTFGMEVL
ncbi:MAG: hypothetical protein WBG42_18120 [Cryomorphaceae bacterium]